MWKNIKEFENLYEVNELGEVRNKKTLKLIKGDINPGGYFRVYLYSSKENKKKRFFRHRLVAEYFIDNPNNLKEVNHKDGDLSHNYKDNLEWVNKKTNELHSRKYGKKEYKPFEVVFNNGFKKQYDVKPDLANELNVSRGLIYQWLTGRAFSYKNYGIKEIYYI